MPKTAEQEKLEGYPGHRKVNKNTPVPGWSIPNPPKWPGRIAARHCYGRVRDIGPNGMRVMAASDRHSPAVTCDMYSKHRKCREIKRKSGDHFTHFEKGKVPGVYLLVWNNQI